MKTNEIKKLIESFYAGQTSQSEELLLFNYFNNEDDVAEELVDEKDIFLHFYRSEPIDVPKSLAYSIESLIDSQAEKEKKKTIAPKHVLVWSSIAASIAIVVLGGVYMNNLSVQGDNSMLVDKQQNSTSLAVTDAEYMEAENAMRLLSYNFNKGMQQLDEMQENLEKTNRILNETFKNN